MVLGLGGRIVWAINIFFYQLRGLIGESSDFYNWIISLGASPKNYGNYASVWAMTSDCKTGGYKFTYC